MFRSAFGKKADAFVSISIALFAFATIAGWAYQGEKAFEFLAGGRTKYNLRYRFVYGLMTFLGCILSLDAVWTFADICNGLMAVPNLICVLLMSGEICRDIQRWKLDAPR
jgi:AGCS family alanine or glycine:cation symporter